MRRYSRSTVLDCQEKPLLRGGAEDGKVKEFLKKVIWKKEERHCLDFVNPITHFLTGWAVANAGGLQRKDRALVTIAGVIPDIDGLGIIAEIATRNSHRPLTWYSDYHHVLGHNVGFCLLVAVLCVVLAGQRFKTTVLAVISFHLHLLGDLVGARGPDGDQWPIPYLLPFSNAWQLTWRGQWALNAWPNFALTGLLIGMSLWLAARRGFSPLEMFSVKADRVLVRTLRDRFRPRLQRHF